MPRANGDCHVCGSEQVEVHLLAACERCRAAAGQFSRRLNAVQASASAPDGPAGGGPVQGWTGVLGCSFCGRRPEEVRRLFSGPWAFICDGCVGLAAEVMKEELGPSWQEGAPSATEGRPARTGTLPGHASFVVSGVEGGDRGAGAPGPALGEPAAEPAGRSRRGTNPGE